MSAELPNYDLNLQSTSSAEDSTAMSLVVNSNNKELANYINQVVEYIKTLSSDTSGITEAQALSLIAGSKYEVIIPVNTVAGVISNANGFRITRTDNPSGEPVNTVLIEIENTDVDRTLNFVKSLVVIKQFDGRVVYPSIVTSISKVSIRFRHPEELNSISGNAATDVNNKRVLIF